jgi:hypothetical protein
MVEQRATELQPTVICVRTWCLPAPPHGARRRHPSERGWMAATITLPAESLSQAAAVSVALVETAYRAQGVAVVAMPASEFDRRGGLAKGASQAERLKALTNRVCGGSALPPNNPQMAAGAPLRVGPLVEEVGPIPWRRADLDWSAPPRQRVMRRRPPWDCWLALRRPQPSGKLPAAFGRARGRVLLRSRTPPQGVPFGPVRRTPVRRGRPIPVRAGAPC